MIIFVKNNIWYIIKRKRIKKSIYEYNIEIGYNVNYYRPAFFLDRENLLAKSVVLSEYFGK